MVRSWLMVGRAYMEAKIWGRKAAHHCDPAILASNLRQERGERHSGSSSVPVGLRNSCRGRQGVPIGRAQLGRWGRSVGFALRQSPAGSTSWLGGTACTVALAIVERLSLGPSPS